VSRWAIAGVVAVVVVVVIVVVVVVSTRRAPTGVRVRVSSGGARPPDAVFTVDSAGRYPGDPGWVDEGATVDV
jgi:hypothetical protein